MATPGFLVSLMAAATGIPVQTVRDTDRKLSEAGLRKKGGRGRSAATMGARDAAVLLLALLAGEGGAGTVPATLRLMSLVPTADEDRSILDDKWDLSWLPEPAFNYEQGAPLVDLVEALIQAAYEGVLEDRLIAGAKASGAKKPDGSDDIQLSLSHAAPGGSVDVLIAAGWGQMIRYGRYVTRADRGGLTQTRDIGLDVFLAIGKGLAVYK